MDGPTPPAETGAPDILVAEREAGGVLRLTLSDERRRNALSEAMLDRLGAAIAEAGRDPETRCVVLAHEGPAFSAGHDLKELTAARQEADGGRAYFARIMERCSAVMQGVVACPKPVIAEVSGVATAAGCQLVASCDLAIAAETARFGTAGVNIGLFCSTPMVALSRNVHDKHAMEMLLTGEMIPAARAAEIGLVNRAVAPERLREETMALAAKIASKSRATLAIGKRAYYEQREMGLAQAYRHCSEVMVANMMAEDAREGIGAFIEKRAPEWRDA